MQDVMPINRALISVYNKTGLDKLLCGLFSYNPVIDILSTGGTHKIIESFRYPVRDVSEYTGRDESPDGLVKTLDQRIHAGIMMDPDIDTHKKYMEKIGAAPIDLVVINFYPLARLISEGKTIEQTRLHGLDVGGPTMVSAAVKAYPTTAVLVSPDDYDDFLAGLDKGTTLATRLKLAKSAARAVETYDREKAEFLHTLTEEECRNFYLGDVY